MMKYTLNIAFGLLLAAEVFGQSQEINFKLRLHNDQPFIAEIDGKTYPTNYKLSIDDLEIGEHQIKIYINKNYVDAQGKIIATRQINIFDDTVNIPTKGEYNSYLTKYRSIKTEIKSIENTDDTQKIEEWDQKLNNEYESQYDEILIG